MHHPQPESVTLLISADYLKAREGFGSPRLETEKGQDRQNQMNYPYQKKQQKRSNMTWQRKNNNVETERSYLSCNVKSVTSCVRFYCSCWHLTKRVRAAFCNKTSESRHSVLHLTNKQKGKAFTAHLASSSWPPLGQSKDFCFLQWCLFQHILQIWRSTSVSENWRGGNILEIQSLGYSNTLQWSFLVFL